MEGELEGRYNEDDEEVTRITVTGLNTLLAHVRFVLQTKELEYGDDTDGFVCDEEVKLAFLTFFCLSECYAIRGMQIPSISRGEEYEDS